MTFSRNSRVVAMLLAGVAMFADAPAWAQTSPSDSNKTNADIIVTAQRRSERLLDVPMAVTALSSEKLEKSGVLNTADLAKVTPGLTMTFYGSNLQPSLRGVSSTGGNTGDNPSVAMYLDGVYQAQQISALFDLPDVEQVEVLKGPQGTLYGQNATGGAIIITTRSPSFTPTGKMSASYGNYDDVQLRGFVSGPIVDDKIAVSLAGSYQNREGFRRNVSTGTRDRGVDSKMVRGKILIEPTDRLKFTATAYYAERDDSTAYAFVPLNDNSLGYALRPNAPRATNPSRQFVGFADPFIDSVLWGASLRAELELDAGKLNWISAYAKSKVTADEDLDASPVNIAQYKYDSLYDETQLHELNFVSRDFGPLSFLAGALYLKTKSYFDRGQYVQYPNFNDPNFVSSLTLTGQPFPTPFTAFRSYGRISKNIWAAYAEATLHVSDALVVTAGGRYTEERQRAIADVGFLPQPIPFPGGKQKWTKFTPRVTARYELSPDSNVYATYAKGFKGGLINTGTGFLLNNVVDPEVITSYEVGFKGRILPSLTVTLDGYWYDYKNLQVVAYGSNNTYLTQNAASTRGKGAELEFSWAATPEFRLSGGVAYTDAKYRSFPNAATFVPTGFGGNTNVTADLSGKRLLRSPKWTANASANYEHEMSAGKVGAYVTVYYNSGQYIESSSRIFQDAYATVDAQLSFAPAALNGVNFVLWGKNLTDKDYLAGALITDFADAVSYAEPRTYGVRAEFQF